MAFEDLQLSLVKAIEKRFGKCFDLSDRVGEISTLKAFLDLQDALYTPWSGTPTFQQIIRGLDGFRPTKTQRVAVTMVCDLSLFEIRRL